MMTYLSRPDCVQKQWEPGVGRLVERRLFYSDGLKRDV